MTMKASRLLLTVGIVSEYDRRDPWLVELHSALHSDSKSFLIRTTLPLPRMFAPRSYPCNTERCSNIIIEAECLTRYYDYHNFPPGLFALSFYHRI